MDKNLINCLHKIYNKFFLPCSDIESYLETLVIVIKGEYIKEEIIFLFRCVDNNIDLETIEISLRRIKKDNIISFIFLRLSAIAESSPTTQSQYINKKPLNIFSVFIFLSTTAINFIVLKVKAKLIYKNLIKEYPNV